MILQSDLRAGLSADEFAEFDEFLKSQCAPNGGMVFSMLDGYLTAIVSGPELILPSEWLPQVWGQREDDDEAGVVFESIDQAKRLSALVLRRMNEISRDFERGEISPIFLLMQPKRSEDEPEGGVRTSSWESADVWCVGYFRGMRIRPRTWDPLRQDPQKCEALLFPITVLAVSWLRFHSEDQEKVLRGYLTPDKCAEFTELVPSAAFDIYRFWRDRRNALPAPVRSASRPGRNETCPCGSMKKYKKCCGRR